MGTDEEGFLAGHFLMQFNAAVINYYFIILQRTYALWIVYLLRAQTRDLTARSLKT